jgi:hypothetical protein
MKERAIQIAQQTLVQGLMSILSEMGDAYFKAAKTYYSNVERVFVKPDGVSFKVNEVIALPTGEIGIRNDVSSLQNLKTLVKMGQNSPNVKFSRRLTALDLLKLIPPSMPGIQVEIIAEMMDTLDLDDDFKAKIASAIENERMLANAQESMQFSTYKSNQANAEGQMAQAQQQGQQQQPQPQIPGHAPVGPQHEAAGPSPQEQGMQQLMAKLAPLMQRNTPGA